MSTGGLAQSDVSPCTKTLIHLEVHSKGFVDLTWVVSPACKMLIEWVFKLVRIGGAVGNIKGAQKKSQQNVASGHRNHNHPVVKIMLHIFISELPPYDFFLITRFVFLGALHDAAPGVAVLSRGHDQDAAGAQGRPHHAGRPQGPGSQFNRKNLGFRFGLKSSF